MFDVGRQIVDALVGRLDDLIECRFELARNSRLFTASSALTFDVRSSCSRSRSLKTSVAAPVALLDVGLRDLSDRLAWRDVIADRYADRRRAVPAAAETASVT